MFQIVIASSGRHLVLCLRRDLRREEVDAPVAEHVEQLTLRARRAAVEVGCEQRGRKSFARRASKHDVFQFRALAGFFNGCSRLILISEHPKYKSG